MTAGDRDQPRSGRPRPGASTKAILLELALTALTLLLIWFLANPIFTDACFGGCAPTSGEKTRARLAALLLVVSACGNVALAVRRGSPIGVVAHGLVAAVALLVVAVAPQVAIVG